MNHGEKKTERKTWDIKICDKRGKVTQQQTTTKAIEVFPMAIPWPIW